MIRYASEESWNDTTLVVTIVITYQIQFFVVSIINCFMSLADAEFRCGGVHSRYFTDYDINLDVFATDIGFVPVRFPQQADSLDAR